MGDAINNDAGRRIGNLCAPVRSREGDF